MAIDERIKAAVTPVVPECMADEYTGAAEEYCTFNFDELPMAHGNNRPHAVRYLIQVHYFLPKGRRPFLKKRELARALLAADFTFPTIENASDETGQHYVFECEAVERVVWDDG